MIQPTSIIKEPLAVFDEKHLLTGTCAKMTHTQSHKLQKLCI